jgi:GTP cyclohydrolase I
MLTYGAKRKVFKMVYTATENAIRYVLDRIGEDPDREGLKGTPKRIVKSWKELFKGYDLKKKPKITTFNNGKDGITYDEMVIDSGDFTSFCEHHWLPFRGHYWFAYIPDKKIIGLSKVARIVDYYSSRLQIQERLVKDIVDEIEKVAQPKGIALVMKAEHMCKSIRGIKVKGEMTTSEVRGMFRTEPAVRAEFMQLIR